MPDDNLNNVNTETGELSPSEEFGQQKQLIGRLYRMREIIAGITALVEDGSVGQAQVKAALQTAFRKMFQ